MSRPSTGAHDGENLARFHLEIDVAEDFAAAIAVTLVGERRALENNALGEGRQRLGIGLLANVVFRVHELEDFRGRADGLLEAVVKQRELANGLIELEDQDDEREEGARREGAPVNLVAAEQEQQGDRDRTEGVHEGRTDRGGGNRAKVRT
jgi:hypothetical protein